MRYSMQIPGLQIPGSDQQMPHNNMILLIKSSIYDFYSVLESTFFYENEYCNKYRFRKLLCCLKTMILAVKNVF